MEKNVISVKAATPFAGKAAIKREQNGSRYLGFDVYRKDMGPERDIQSGYGKQNN